MCNKTCQGSKKQEGTISLTEEEKDLLVSVLNDTLFRIGGLTLAHQILEKIDQACPITEE